MLLVILFVVGVNGITFDPPEWTEGEQGSFYCSNPNAVIIRKNGDIKTTCPVGFSCSPAPPSYSRIERDGTKVTFIIPTVNRSRDSATWSCGGNSATIDVKVPVPSVTIIDKNSLNFTDGQTTSITCKTGASDSPANITWSIGGTNITSENTTNNPDGTTTSILQYYAKKADHNKSLQCSATNGYGSPQTDSITLLIRFAVPSVTIVNKNSLNFTDGQTTSISSKTGVSYPPANITWSIDGTNINSTTTTTNNTDGTTTSILQYNAKKADRDKILQCSATNGYGSPQTDNLTILIRSKPELKNNASINRCLSAIITVFAYPPPTCKWFINGQVSQDVSTVDSNGNEHTCKLSSNSEFTNIDHGDYYVNISNELGFMSHSFTVPDGIDLYPFYLLIVQALRIVIVILLIVIIIIGTEKGTNVTTIVSIITGVLIAVCVIILIYVLAHIVEVFWIIVSCIMVVFGILTAILIPIIHLLITKKVEDKNVKSVFWGLIVLSAVVIIFSLALLIFICVILAQYDVCEKDNLIGGACLQAVDLLFTIGLTGLVYKKLGL